VRVGKAEIDVELDDAAGVVSNGDGLTYHTLQNDLLGLQVNTAQPLGDQQWRIVPNEPIAQYKDLRAGTALSRNRDMAWDRLLGKKSAERRIGVTMQATDTADGFALDVRDADGIHARATIKLDKLPAQYAAKVEPMLREHLGKLGNTPFVLERLGIAFGQPWFVPASALNALRRDAIAALEAARAAALQRPPRAVPVQPPAPYPGDALTYLANVYNHKAHDFYVKHGVTIIDAAYESHQELGEVSLMITKHCVRWSLSLCPKQAKGVTGVQGTIRAEPLTMTSGGDTLTLRFDCKPCEMHVVGRIKRHVLNETKAQPITFYRARPAVPA
jgi:23S rRNA 5-hydroxycytidine C2501 synthase